MRWERGGAVLGMASLFDPEFPDSRLVAQVGRRMTTQILDDVARWRQRDICFGHVAVNSCASDFASDHYAEELLQALQERRIPPTLIELEVTEGVFVGRGSSHVARALNGDRGGSEPVDGAGRGEPRASAARRQR